jgi:hypothetical protein
MHCVDSTRNALLRIFGGFYHETTSKLKIILKKIQVSTDVIPTLSIVPGLFNAILL